MRRLVLAALLGFLAVAGAVAGLSFGATSPTPSVSVGGSSPNEVVTGSTVYYAPTGTNSGSFTVSASWKGIGNPTYDFPNVFSDDPSPSAMSSHGYSWTAGASDSGSKTVTITGTTTSTSSTGTTTTTTATTTTGTASFTVTPDTAPPSGQTVTLGGGPGFSTLSVPLVLKNGTDTGVGVDSSSGVVESASASLVNGMCGTFGPYATLTLSGSADTSVTTGKCYRYEYKIADRLGNLSALSAPSGDAKVDSTPPTLPALSFSGLTNSAASGSVVYYRPGAKGSFTVVAISSDPESAVASYSFPNSTSLTVVGSGSARTFEIPASQVGPAGPFTVTATNGTGLGSPAAAFSLQPDSVAPIATIQCNGKPCRPTAYQRDVTVTLGAKDAGGSGVGAIWYTIDGTTPSAGHGAEYGGPFVLRTRAVVRTRAFDRVGNASALETVTIHSTADRLSFTAPLRLNVATAAKYLQARVNTSKRIIVTAVLTGPGLRKAQQWRFILPSGPSIVRLRLPALSRTGRFRLVWHLSAGSQKVTKTSYVYRRAVAHRATKK